MEENERQGRVANSITIISSRFADNFVKSISTYDYCIKLAQSKRVTGQIVQKLLTLGIEE
jgi:hypothetical protein